MRKIISVFALTVILGVILAACSTANGNNEAVEPDLSTDEMVEQMLAEVEQPDLIELEDENVTDFYEVDLDNIEEYTAKIPMMNVHTNEIAIFKVKEEADVAEVEAAAKERAELVQKNFETYLQDQYEIAKNYQLETKGNYVLFVISEDADKLTNVFESFFEKD